MPYYDSGIYPSPTRVVIMSERPAAKSEGKKDIQQVHQQQLLGALCRDSPFAATLVADVRSKQQGVKMSKPMPPNPALRHWISRMVGR
ncbi:uncharacterized protein PG998_002231 [Apiospora kogelbergensis]|uniref:Uncharacterized protein n=1 Tax=Apiospora kogelbergensis TaxID=1337665 RepID=A0AAW0Q7E0_9PEZI